MQDIVVNYERSRHSLIFGIEKNHPPRSGIPPILNTFLWFVRKFANTMLSPLNINETQENKADY